MKTMYNTVIKIEFTYNNHGDRESIKITRGSFYLKSITREYKDNLMSDAQHALSVMLSNRDKWTTFFYKNSIISYPAWFMLFEGEKCRAAGSLENCKHWYKPGMKIVRKMDYPDPLLKTKKGKV